MFEDEHTLPGEESGMNSRTVIAALSAVVMTVSIAPSLAQTPEDSAAAKAAPQAPNEKAMSSSSALPAPSDIHIRRFDVTRSTTDSAGKAALATPEAKK
jgi:hypothetical protein